MDRQLPKQLLRMVDTLDEAQLHALYHVVAQRLQLAQKAHALAAMSQFHVLDRVSFLHNGKQLQGTVTRLNQKTVSIMLEDGTRWNVAPSLLTKVADRQETVLQLLREVESGQWVTHTGGHCGGRDQRIAPGIQGRERLPWLKEWLLPKPTTPKRTANESPE